MSEEESDYQPRCAYCLQPPQYMFDPRVLPCKHAFCKECIEEFHCSLDVVECMECKVMHSGLDIAHLPAMHYEDKSAVLSDEAVTDVNEVMCDVCKEKKADRYCPECKKTSCNEHTKFHDIYFGSQHATIGMEDYKSRETTGNNELCSVHQKEAEVACQNCFQLNCVLCDFTSDCQDGIFRHQFVPLKEIKISAVKTRYMTKLGPLSSEVTHLHRLEKRTVQQYEEILTHCDAVSETIQSAAKAEILLIREKSKQMLDQVSDFTQTNVEQAEKFVDSLLKQRCAITEVERSTRQALNSERSLPALLSNLNVLNKKIAEQSRERRKQVIDCDIFQSKFPMIVGKTFYEGGDHYQIAFVAHSIQMIRCKNEFTIKDARSIHIGSSLAVLAHTGTQIVEFKAESRYQSIIYKLSECESLLALNLTPSQTMLYVCTVPSNTKVACVKDHTGRRIFRFQYEQYLSSPLIASSIKWIAVVPNGGSNNIILCNRASEKPFTAIVGCSPSYLHFSSTEELLVTDTSSDILVKFSVNQIAGDLKLLWIGNSIDKAGAIASDDQGHIYVTSSAQKTVYLISTAGVVMKKLRVEQMPCPCLSINVKGKDMALADNQTLCICEMVDGGK